jgi:hypothetical protein
MPCAGHRRSCKRCWQVPTWPFQRPVGAPQGCPCAIEPYQNPGINQIGLQNCSISRKFKAMLSVMQCEVIQLSLKILTILTRESIAFIAWVKA